jgi:proteasome lid subunit RPN8/RPN11
VTGTSTTSYSIAADAFAAMVAQAHRGYPYEVCGLLAGVPGSAHASRYYPCRNAAESARVYTIDPRDHLRAERHAEDDGLEIVGVVHSHTHTEPYPSPTDVAAAPDPGWRYVIIGLKRDAPEVRCYRIVDDAITEETLTIA